jgi:Fe-S cluster biogenesis protein NfuA
MLQEAEHTVAAPSCDREQIIRAVIDDIRPNLRRDGGDCELVEVCGNKIMVKLTGACVLCKLSSATLEGIQAKIIEKLGEFVRLVPVPSAPSRH